MATVLDPNQNNQQSQGTNPPNIGGLAPQASTSSSATPQATPNKPASSGNFVGLQKYMQASRGDNLGQNVANQIAQGGQSVKQNLGQSKQQFQQGELQGSIGGMVGAQTSGSIQDNLKAAQTQGQQAISQASQGIMPTNAQQFQNIVSSQYTGPNSLANLAQLRAQATAAQNLGQQSQTSAGQANLLNQLYGKSSYNAGQQGLDQLLLGQARPQLAQARQGLFGLQKDIGREAGIATGEAQQTAQTQADIQAQLKDQLTQAAQGTRQDIENKVWQNAQAQAAGFAQGAGGQGESLGDFMSGGGAQKYERAGIIDYARQPGESLADYAARRNTNAQDLIANAATPEQVAKLQALSSLGGGAVDLSQYTNNLTTGNSVNAQDLFNQTKGQGVNYNAAYTKRQTDSQEAVNKANDELAQQRQYASDLAQKQSQAEQNERIANNTNSTVEQGLFTAANSLGIPTYLLPQDVRSNIDKAFVPTNTQRDITNAGLSMVSQVPSIAGKANTMVGNTLPDSPQKQALQQALQQMSSYNPVNDIDKSLATASDVTHMTSSPQYAAQQVPKLIGQAGQAQQDANKQQPGESDAAYEQRMNQQQMQTNLNSKAY